jgi:lysophospholipase L1-like esterase/pimeloyl-ACP methyl ester carboxylesterase
MQAGPICPDAPEESTMRSAAPAPRPRLRPGTVHETRIWLMALWLSATAAGAGESNFLAGVKRVVFLGDSITYSGQYIEAVEIATRRWLPERSIEFLNLGLPSETVSGLSEPGHAGGAFPRPSLQERLERVLSQTKPDLIIACYGMNDGIYYPFGEQRFQKFREGIERLREKAAQAGARVLHLTPPVFDPLPLRGRTLPAGRDEYRQPYEGYDDVLGRYSEWLLAQRAKGWEVIDVHGPMSRHLAEARQKEPSYRLAGDGVHINATGHWLIARELLLHFRAPVEPSALESLETMLSTHPRGSELRRRVEQRQRMSKDAWLTAVGHLRPGMAKGLTLEEAQTRTQDLETQIKEVASPFPGRRSSWEGFERFDFQVDGKPALVVLPAVAASGKPWVWHGEFFGHKPAPDVALLGRGFHVVYLSVPDMLGCPEAVAHWNVFYKELTERYGFGKRPALVGLSRGGLYCYNWAAANPDKVGCIYGDAPVCDFKSWPGGKGKGKGSARDWKLVLEKYRFATEADALAYARNPVDNLAGLAKAKVPLLHVFGDADDVVPWEENTGLLADRYQKLGGSIRLIRKPGVGHHPHGLEDSTPLVEFIQSSMAGASK